MYSSSLFVACEILKEEEGFLDILFPVTCTCLLANFDVTFILFLLFQYPYRLG